MSDDTHSTAAAEDTQRPPDVEKVKLWDPLLRVFHWALAIAVITAWGLGEYGPSIMTLHFYAGYTVCGLILFRILWGFVGPKPARFTHFLRGPSAITGYLSHMFHRHPSYWPGHNPLGALAVLAILGVLSFQVVTGLISDPEDYVNVGPFAGAVPHDLATEAVGLHHTGATLILLLVILHIGIIFFYRFWKREDLVTPMLTGWKWVRRKLGQ
ncbi:cytochrome b/b6 domain-containing protein [Paracoccaceae bacterium GXU_MW_L88]